MERGQHVQRPWGGRGYELNVPAEDNVLSDRPAQKSLLTTLFSRKLPEGMPQGEDGMESRKQWLQTRRVQGGQWAVGRPSWLGAGGHGPGRGRNGNDLTARERQKQTRGTIRQTQSLGKTNAVPRVMHSQHGRCSRPSQPESSMAAPEQNLNALGPDHTHG